MARSADLGLQLGLAAFVVALVAPLAPLLNLLLLLLGVACAAVLSGDARRRGGMVARQGFAGLALMLVGFVGLIVASAVAARAPDGNAAPAGAVWFQLIAEVAVAAAFYLVAVHLTQERSQALLGLAFGASLAISVAGAWALLAGSPLAESAALAKGVPFILFAWAYATILGRLRAAEARRDPWRVT